MQAICKIEQVEGIKLEKLSGTKESTFVDYYFCFIYGGLVNILRQLSNINSASTQIRVFAEMEHAFEHKYAFQLPFPKEIWYKKLKWIDWSIWNLKWTSMSRKLDMSNQTETELSLVTP